MRTIEFDHGGPAVRTDLQQLRIGTAKSEYGLVGVTRDDTDTGPFREQPDQQRRLRIKMLSIVHEEKFDAITFRG
ncbi:Uncharacterised protein [Mycobacteroides abscessus subsp. massiliense]|nr:Uncharacterised protein [Mycobacteroides abscessus subsp. abscessus]SKK08334.1 Uncharacterised protein [Mycobacteroides abscessus subsp. massiliense]